MLFMEIPNLSSPNISPTNNTPLKAEKISISIVVIVSAIALALGFWISRMSPVNQGSQELISGNNALSTDSISGSDDLEVGKIYGNTSKNFKDSAVGIVEKGSINGEGTHILNREGGASQRAALTSSTVDLDLFIGKKVEIKGETNASNKASWFMDVGSVKLIE